MGNFMIPVCCVCGTASTTWHNSKWEDDGGLQDFRPKHANILRQKYGDFIECTNLRSVNETEDSG